MLYLLKQMYSCDYDENIGLIVRAKNSSEARKLANSCCEDEGLIWTDRALTSCNRLKEDGDSEIILISNTGE